MFETVFLERLSEEDSRRAIEKPIKKSQSQLAFSAESIETIIKTSSGYPYFIRFICKEVFDSFIRQIESGIPKPRVPVEEIIKKLDVDFFSGRWGLLTDRQRDLLNVVASLDHCSDHFTTKDVVAKSQEILEKPFGSSQITQLFDVLQRRGIIYRNRHGKYSFAVPLFDEFIKRQSEENS
ncbi:MAG TPA: hypothetical protein VIS48_12985 [Candidatus Kryptonia bacterium]